MSPVRERKPQPVPPLTKPRKQRLPSVAERLLPNGLRVVAVRRASVPLVHLRLRVPNAIRRDADLAKTSMLSRTMMLGTSTHSQAGLAEALQRIGGGLRVSDGADGLAFAGESLRPGLGELLGLLGEVLTDAAYPRTDAEREAGGSATIFGRLCRSPASIADEAWLRRRYGDHPYGRSMPTLDEVADVSLRSLKALHRRRVVPGGSLLVLVGDLDAGARPRPGREGPRRLARRPRWCRRTPGTRRAPPAATARRPARTRCSPTCASVAGAPRAR